MNPIQYLDGQACYRGKDYADRYIYDYTVNTIGDDEYLSGKKVFPNTLVKNIPGIYYEEDKTYIFPGDCFRKTVLDKDDKLIYSLMNIHAEEINGDIVLVDSEGKKRELLMAFTEGNNKVIFTKE